MDWEETNKPHTTYSHDGKGDFHLCIQMTSADIPGCWIAPMKKFAGGAGTRRSPTTFGHANVYIYVQAQAQCLLIAIIVTQRFTIALRMTSYIEHLSGRNFGKVYTDYNDVIK